MATTPLFFRIGMNVAVVMQIAIGYIGARGLIEYLMSDPDNTSRYQLLMAPIWSCVFCIPLLILALLFYRMVGHETSTFELIVLSFASSFPVLVAAVAIAVSML